MLPFLDSLEKKVKNLKKTFGIRLNPWPILAVGLAILLTSFLFMPGAVSLALSISLFLAPLWLPVLLVGSAWTLFTLLKRSEFIADQKCILLEIKPPRNLVKTPLAMEAVLSGMHIGPGESTWYKKYILGGTRPWWSLEIVSFEGQVRFFIWARADLRRIVEAQLYAQYPGVQIVEAPDYTRLITAKSSEGWSIWGCDFTHTSDDPLPIKTYIEYGLDRVQKEPEQVDPLANLIEFIGSMKKGEHLWLQLIIRIHKGEKYNKKNEEGKVYNWKDEAKKLIDEIRVKTRDEYIDPVTGDKRPGFPNPTKGQSEKIAAIERNVSKLGFDVGIRGIYLASGKFDTIAISGLTGIFKQFSSEGWNGIAPSGWMTDFDDYPWELGISKLKEEYRQGIIQAYRRRQFFHEPFKADAMVMSTEELATIFHIPSRAVETPSLGRIQSATSEAPANLPT